MTNGGWLAAGFGAVLLLPGALRADRPASTPARPPKGVRLRLQRVTWRRSGQLQFGPAGQPLPGKRTVNATASLEFGMEASDPATLDAIAGDVLSERPFRVVDDTGAVSRATVELIREEGETRLRIVAGSLSPRATKLLRIEGELPRFPQSEKIRFHVPWLKDEIPVRVEFGGAVATLQRFRLVGDDSTLWVKLTPPEGYRVAGPGGSQVTARAMDIDGNLVNGGGITETELTESGPNPVFRFFAPDMRRTPSRLMLDVLFVAGAPRWEPLHYGAVALPIPSE